MEKLITAIENLKQTVKKNKIDVKFAKITQDTIGELKQELFISAELVKLYTDAAPIDFEIDWSAEWLLLYPPEELIEYQIGYRWIDDEKKQMDKCWKENWVAIGDCSGDPIIADIAKGHTPISMAIHGTGNWSPMLIASSLDAYINALSIWINLTNTKFKGKIRHVDGTLNEDLSHELKEKLHPILTGEYLTNFFRFL